MKGLAVAILTALAGAALAQAPLEEAETHYSHALYALNEGDLAGAADAFRAAAEAAPDEPLFWYELGRVENRRGEYAGAIEALERARRLGEEAGGLAFDLGVAYVGAGRVEESRPLFEEAVRHDPGHAAAHLYLGSAVAAAGETEDAVAHYERAAELDPALADEAAYLTGRAYLNEGMDEEAKAALRSAAEGSDERVARLSRDFLGRIEAGQRTGPSPWRLTGYLAAEYDDNVTLNPEDPAVTDFPSTGKSDLRAVGYGQVRYLALTDAHNVFGLEYAFYLSRHESLSEYDLTGHLPGLFYLWRKEPCRLRAEYGLRYFDLDGADYMRRHEGKVRFSLGEGEVGRTEFLVRYWDDHYFGTAERDAVEWGAGVEQHFYPWRTLDRQLSVKLAAADRDSGHDYDRSEVEVGVSYFTELSATWDLYASLGYTEYDYSNVNSYFGERRDDEEWEVMLRAVWDVTDAVSLLFQLRLTDHPSSIEFYDYDRQVLTVGLLARR
jgi:tetratricopeptide (TPR) repeat protein